MSTFSVLSCLADSGPELVTASGDVERPCLDEEECFGASEVDRLRFL